MLKESSTENLLNDFLDVAYLHLNQDYSNFDIDDLVKELARRIDNGNNGNHYHNCACERRYG